MKNTKIKTAALLLALSLTAGGCVEKPYELTDEEQAVIVNYAAHVVAKYNTWQPDGISRLSQARYDELMARENPAGEDVAETETEQSPQGTPDTPQNTAEPSGNAQSEEASLSDFVGKKGISAEYTGAELLDSYTDSGAYALDAEPGKKLLAVHITLTNTRKKKDVSCDLLSTQAVYTIETDNGIRTTAKTTILLNDFGTYQGTIAPGESVDTVLLFDVPADQADGISQTKLIQKVNGTSKTVQL